MLKNFFLIFVIIFLASCGYEAMHSKNKLSDTDFSITEIEFKGERDINIKIEEKLKKYTKIIKKKSYFLLIENTYAKETIARDSKGDPTVFEIKVNVFVTVMNKNNIKAKIPFRKNFKYNNDRSRFEQKRHEKEIKEGLAETISSDIIIKISNLK
jgi:outer membrane lipopolysaccharide assembly protein LptE/RlpB